MVNFMYTLNLVSSVHDIRSDLFTYELTEANWDRVRTAVRYYIASVESLNIEEELVHYQELIYLLDIDKWLNFRLSRDRMNGLETPRIPLHVSPKLTECCSERYIRASNRSKWRCNGCGAPV